MSEEVDRMRNVAHSAADLVVALDGKAFDWETIRVLKREIKFLQEIAPEFRRNSDVPENSSN